MTHQKSRKGPFEVAGNCGMADQRLFANHVFCLFAFSANYFTIILHLQLIFLSWSRFTSFNVSWIWSISLSRLGSLTVISFTAWHPLMPRPFVAPSPRHATITRRWARHPRPARSGPAHTPAGRPTRGRRWVAALTRRVPHTHTKLCLPSVSSKCKWKSERVALLYLQRATVLWQSSVPPPFEGSAARSIGGFATWFCLGDRCRSITTCFLHSFRMLACFSLLSVIQNKFKMEREKRLQQVWPIIFHIEQWFQCWTCLACFGTESATAAATSTVVQSVRSVHRHGGWRGSSTAAAAARKTGFSLHHARIQGSSKSSGVEIYCDIFLWWIKHSFLWKK